MSELQPVTLFVFASPNELSEEITEQIIGELKLFFTQWSSHGIPVRAEVRIEKKHFVIVQIDENSENPGGCSKDSLFRKIHELEQKLKIILLDRKYFFLENPNQHTIEVVPFLSIDSWKKQHPDFLEWKWYDTSVVRSEQWKKNPVPVNTSALLSKKVY